MIPSGLLPEDYESDAYIAGGWAACPALANDMDVWVLVPKGKLEQSRANILSHLLDCKVRMTEEVDNTTLADYEGVAVQIRKVAQVRFGMMSKPIHIMVTDADHIEQLLDGFDISTHQLAISSRGGIYVGRNFTPITTVPQVIGVNYNEKTEARLLKIAARYGHALEAKASIS